MNLQIGLDIGAQRFRESGDVEKEAIGVGGCVVDVLGI